MKRRSHFYSPSSERLSPSMRILFRTILLIASASPVSSRKFLLKMCEVHSSNKNFFISHFLKIISGNRSSISSGFNVCAFRIPREQICSQSYCPLLFPSILRGVLEKGNLLFSPFQEFGSSVLSFGKSRYLNTIPILPHKMRG